MATCSAALSVRLVRHPVPELEPDDIEEALGPFDSVERVGQPSGSGECFRTERAGEVRAVKVVVRGSDPERLRREVAALQRVDDDRVVAILDHGDLTARDGRTFPYIASEFIAGGDVDDVLDDCGEPDDDELRAFVKGCLEGLEILHAANIVHRDFKPANETSERRERAGRIVDAVALLDCRPRHAACPVTVPRGQSPLTIVYSRRRPLSPRNCFRDGTR